MTRSAHWTVAPWAASCQRAKLHSEARLWTRWRATVAGDGGQVQGGDAAHRVADELSFARAEVLH
ncbi:MAG: hypothetical protein QGH25_15935 [Candidatus Latescibacteria bacterium]|nr:hypothetical protein [Candidatus Latescibacterota bacterium]